MSKRDKDYREVKTIMSEGDVSKGWINWPIPCDECKGEKAIMGDHDTWHDSGENGMEVYLVVLLGHKDSVCNSNLFIVVGGGEAVSKHSFKFNPDLSDGKIDHMFNAAILLGSTKRTLWNPRQGVCFTASRDNLTSDGLKLFETIAKLFDREPEIVTALDT